jgi:predicted nucleic acid-binding protein
MGITLQPSTIVFLDTAPFIYFFEKHSKYFPYLEKLFDQVYKTGAQVITSMITFIEISTYPARLGHHQLVQKYRDFFTNAENISLFPIDLTIAEQSIVLRAEYKLKTPDAIQLGTAITCGADYIITHDKTWQRFTQQQVLLVDEI